ncbi:helix-turn-helix transcriptional regulator [Mesorhizobium sp. B2-4-6]|uniref:helix-turn-helix transcriptional regulator n=1 Tax=Mesorhizobium sp. B2-4-6 TaxID=2589943 RepID=UPI00112EEDFE|nr:helix-turn-helix transcriptional regulator [Mesorhizobium sp. B2-4-6]TPL46401.1 helix-turn-helix transcriptional regulator [Mesorhizobium sp. B2-4-6]
MGTTFDLGAISVAFSAAALDPSQWDAAMEVAERATESAGALLFDVRRHSPRIPHSQGSAEGFETYVKGGWIHRDERYRLLPFLARRGVATDFDIFTPDEITRHPYYQDFLSSQGLLWYAGVKVGAGDDFWCLSLQRSIDKGPFSPSELEELARLSRHLGPSVAVARALGFARAESSSDAFGASGRAAVLLDGGGKVVLVNPAAEALLGLSLQVRCGRLVSWNKDATDALDRSLRELLWVRTPSATMPPVALPRIEGRSLIAYPMRLGAVSPNALAPCQAVVVILDPDSDPQPPEAILRSCFGLTAAEAGLARHISSGRKLESIADELGIRYETARNHLKAVFAKTQTHRQSELVALLARLANAPPR